jgi:SAM-dependent methyltransferase
VTQATTVTIRELPAGETHPPHQAGWRSTHTASLAGCSRPGEEVTVSPDSPAAHVYNEIGVKYTTNRQPDPRIEQHVLDALGDARSVVNVGAGTGAYEPSDREVLAVEPSRVMRAQRPPNAARCIDASAESLPLPDGSFDTAMALLSLHHWSDWRAGVGELRRIARKRVVIFTYDPSFAGSWWLKRDYLPELVALDIRRFPTIAEQAAAAGEATVANAVPIPHDCRDGFLGAYWRRPHAYLDPDIRAGISTFHLPGAEALLGGLDQLARDLDSGHWEQRNHDILDRIELDLGYRLLTARI